MTAKYDAADIEVLSGLDPVRRRPGMYTDTSRPNHLAQEVVDNSVDEAIAGFAKKIEVIVHNSSGDSGSRLSGRPFWICSAAIGQSLKKWSQPEAATRCITGRPIFMEMS